jgi:hypothetical protein
LCNGWSKEELRYVTYDAQRLRQEQEKEHGWEDKVLELPKRRLSTRILRQNLRIKQSIQEVA